MAQQKDGEGEKSRDQEDDEGTPEEQFGEKEEELKINTQRKTMGNHQLKG